MTHAALKIGPTIELTNEDDVSTPTVVLPTIAPDVRRLIAAEIAATDTGLESAFACTYDMTTRTITGATLVARGSLDKVLCVSSDLKSGEMFLHNHPAGTPIWPSDTDLESAKTLAALGIGSAICDPTGELLYVTREPLQPRRSRFRILKLWRFLVCWDTRQ